MPWHRRKRIRRGTAIVALGVSIAVSSCGGGTEDKFGRQLFEQTCSPCHGIGGVGTIGRPALNAGSNAASLTDDQIRGVIAVGPGAMPSFATRLSAEQVDSLVEYLRSIQGLDAGD